MNITEKNTLAEIVAADYRTARIFENYNLDFCCRGNRSLDEACREKELNSGNILKEIITEVKSPAIEKYVEEWALDQLTDHIINVHHTYVKRMIPVIDAHSLKVSEVHGSNHPEVVQIANIFETVRDELLSHMMKEEKMLFPYIKQLIQHKKNGSGIEAMPFGSISVPIKVMEREHSEAGEGFYKIRELSNNYTPPDDACTTYRILYKELEEFEKDLHRHIHLENNILFPGAIQTEYDLNH